MTNNYDPLIRLSFVRSTDDVVKVVWIRTSKIEEVGTTTTWQVYDQELQARKMVPCKEVTWIQLHDTPSRYVLETPEEIARACNDKHL